MSDAPLVHDATAPGWPGIDPRWTSSAKTGVGAAHGRDSSVWFTLSHGILNEIYYPRIDTACTRDVGLIVTDGKDFFSEEKRDVDSTVEYLAEGIPAYRMINTCASGRYRVEKEIVASPTYDAVLIRTRFLPLVGKLSDYRVHALLAPHLGNRGAGNTAWIGEYKGEPMLFASRASLGLALASSATWKVRSVGYVGISDGWQDLSRHRRLTWSYERAADGNVALVGEIDVIGCGGEFLLVIAFGTGANEAGNGARASLMAGFDAARRGYEKDWTDWQSSLLDLRDLEAREREIYRVSTAMLHVHEAKLIPGGAIASLSIPWGYNKGDDDLGGYHLVWPRDLVETATALLAVGAKDDARKVLDYLRSTQESDGRWPQNMWLDGEPYWNGVQMDEAAFPILLARLCLRHGALSPDEAVHYWPMVKRAAKFVLLNGPVTPEDRWEENSGCTPFTLAVEIAGLLGAAEFAELAGEHDVAVRFRETADAWNDAIEDWIYAENSDLAREAGVEGFYVRIAPPDDDSRALSERIVHVKNSFRSLDVPADHLVSQDALALVRFGLRAADDPRILNTVKVIDHLLKVETPLGPCWRRYNNDGYGEHDGGGPFDGSGVGRAWPLLTGERAHYALAAGQMDEARHLRAVMARFANQGGLLPEQVWDAADVPERELFFGKPTGSAMPLVWAHAEYVKLLRSLHDGRVFDMPSITVERYLVKRTTSLYATWRFSLRSATIPAGKTLRLELGAPAMVHWTADDWRTATDSHTVADGLGLHLADLPTASLEPGGRVSFTFFWTDTQCWENQNFRVVVRA